MCTIQMGRTRFHCILNRSSLHTAVREISHGPKERDSNIMGVHEGEC